MKKIATVLALAVSSHAYFSVAVWEEEHCRGEQTIQYIAVDSCAVLDNPFRSFQYLEDVHQVGDDVQEMRVFANSECDFDNATHGVTFPIPGSSAMLQDSGCATEGYSVFRPEDCINIVYTLNTPPSLSIKSWWSQDTEEKCGNSDHYIKEECHSWWERMQAYFQVGSARRCQA